MLIDGYSHCGLSKYRPVEDVLAVMQSAGVEQAVLCQHLGEYDNSYLAEVVGRYPETFAAVCLVDPASPSGLADLEKWHATGRFRGVRLYAGWLDEHRPLCARAVELGMTLVIYASHGATAAAPEVARFMTEHPDARVVLTHLGNPELNDDGLFWSNELLELRQFEGVYVQWSGLSMFCEYPYTAANGFVRTVIRSFGAERVYWGSNFPVCGGADEYRRDLLQIAAPEWRLTSDEARLITGGTAQRLWFSAAT